ncbi:MAG TPA: bifunctional [glutamate--ammonia ligase]-adenylyl-L-tyrosine phosphorylase/[glutamate--ammonia-ligase] adenylyltransferase [Polyangiaceae bacterium]|nr:bifunctional [glutamate--ammonia ligase]-adenylyl-L-tyrosine phosphorylase/[glutamate--ammonia-ligase] adenylyltransferase [Polyangiaceae bacterium]
MEDPARWLSLADAIDCDRARELGRELGAAPERAALVLLGTAFPPLCTLTGPRVDAFARLVSEGLQSERRGEDLLRKAPQPRAAPGEDPTFGAALRRFVWAERARIALRELLPLELGGAPIAVTARELSALAEVSLSLALTEAELYVAKRTGPPLRADGAPSTLVAFGMGKLGGKELNAGSDVDLVFVYDTDEGASTVPLHEHWTRVVRRAVATIDTPTEEGFVWRVDLRLRPEGSRGPLVNSVAATERYYETWGRLWERAALLRARPIAGDRALGALVEREIFTPFVYRHAVEPGLAFGLADLLERSRRELSKAPERDLKLGPGGIREAEFFVQTLQLVWGGKEPVVRARGTVAALSRLKSRGLVTDRETRTLSAAYAFLRRLEHRVQWTTGVQTHLVPDGQDELARLSRSLGYADERPLLAELARVRAEVSELFESVLPERRSAPPARFAELSSALGDPERAAAASEALFATPEVGEHLSALARRPDALLGELTRERHPKLADALLDALVGCPDPEQAARLLRAFFGRFSTPAPYVNALAEDAYALGRMVTVLGSSAFVGDAVVARPELADVVLFGRGAVSDPVAAVALELETKQRALAPDADPAEVQEAFVDALRTAKRRVVVEVAVADLAGSIGTRETTRRLSDLADAILARTAEHVLGDGARGLALIALGKLGGRDIGYGSDLDVIFVYDPSAAPSPDEASSYFARAAQRIIRLISEPSAAGPGYELDTRLRPSGSKGLLVTSLGAFARYHGIAIPETRGLEQSPTSSGAAWERQALLRARACAGDAALGERVVAVAEAAAYEGGAPPAAEMHRLRERMEQELARERPGRYDLKTGRGGLLDVEFCVQWLQMKNGADPRVRTPDTALALEALAAAGYLERKHFETLRDGYAFLRRLEQRIHVLTGQSASVIDVRAPGLPELARRMGLSDEPGHPAADQLLASYELVTTSVRRAYRAALGV